METGLAENLLAALQKIDRPARFCMRGSVPAVLPGLEVTGLGPIALPLTDEQAQRLKSACEQAPYGKGTETLVDTAVRRVWRLEPSRFTVRNPDWEKFVLEQVGSVREQLGLDKELQPHLYELLLYEPGSFFLPHQDGEKLDRMVATLVIVLPSEHEGGELVVRHDGQEEVIDFGAASSNPYQIHLAAFYADCKHEIRPLRRGHRLCLVYNLTLAGGNNDVKAPRASEHIEELSGLLRRWADDPASRKLVITLGHEYTEKGLAWDMLKGADSSVADVLDAAAKRANCKAYLALLTFHESGAAEPLGSSRRYRRGRGDWYDDGDSSDYEMGEIYDTSLTATNWQDRNGNAPLKEVSIGLDDLLDPEVIRAVDPEVEFEGYTGNAGMTLDHWYRHAAIILWPEKRTTEIICEEDPSAAIPWLDSLVAAWRGADKAHAPAQLAQCMEVATAIVNNWRPRPYGGYGEKPASDKLFPLLKTLHATGLLEAYLHKLMPEDVLLHPGAALAEFGMEHGWQALAAPLTALLRNTNSASMPRDLRVFEDIAGAKSGHDDNWSVLCGVLAQAMVAALERIDLEKTDWRASHLQRQPVLATLVRSCLAARQAALLGRVIDHTLQRIDLYPLHSVHLAVLAGLQASLADEPKELQKEIRRWVAACAERLSARMPEKPKDCARPAQLRCTCRLCQELKEFLANSSESVHRFKAVQADRGHLEHVIKHEHCDVDMHTEKTRPSHTLVCTKNMNSYERAMADYNRDCNERAMLEAIKQELDE